MLPRRRPFYLSPLACLLCLGCFSTIAPDTDQSGPAGPGNGAAKANVRGRVLLYRAQGQWDNHATGVQVRWLDISYRQIDESTVRSNNDGIFAAFTTDPRVRHVQVAALKCEYNSLDPAPRFTCCLDPQPCPGGCESPWDTSYRMPVTLGGTAYRELRIACDGT